MRKIYLLLCIACMFLALCGCEKALESSKTQEYAETNQVYLSEVAGKCYQAKGGQLLTFYKDGVATYDFQNGVGENHHYNYRVLIETSSEAGIDMVFVKLEDVSDNYYTHDYIDNGAESVAFDRNKQTMSLYSLTYNCIYDDSAFGENKNAYGTHTTICEEEGCERYIAPTGDTHFCTEHTNSCSRCKAFINPPRTICDDCPVSGESSGSKTCGACNGSGYLKYYYGDSDLQAYLDGYDPYTVGKCTSCGG